MTSQSEQRNDIPPHPRPPYPPDEPTREGVAASDQEIDVRDCPECDNGTKGTYDGRVLIGGRGIFTCPVCGTRWQDENEKPSSKGIPVNLGRSE